MGNDGPGWRVRDLLRWRGDHELLWTAWASRRGMVIKCQSPMILILSAEQRVAFFVVVIEWFHTSHVVES